MVTVTFGEDMDQTVAPVAADFNLELDGVPKVPTAVHWTTATTLVLDYSEALLDPALVELRFSTKTDQFLSVLGELVTPFDIEVIAE